jgi:5-methylcytosine-specific restriction endonuclease McrA
MKNKKLNAVHVWKQMQDLLVPRLHLSVIDRAVYFHLLRHSRLEGRAQLRFSILWLARGACLSTATARKAVRSLVGKGVLRLTERSKAGHVVTVCLPEEIRSVRTDKIAACTAVRVASVADLEEADFLETRALREAIHEREGGCCFYCLRRMRPMVRCVDHVVAQVRGGRNGYRNLVSACSECNSQKGEQRAEDFLRWLFREGRLSTGELSGRLGALARLAAGKLRPPLENGK